ncbi:MAG: replication restart helicase PriA [Spirochaetota bacterium]
MFVEVIFNMPLNRSFTYETEEGSACTLGVRVTAPFGKRRLTGYVIESDVPKPEGYEVKQIEKIIDSVPVFRHQEIELSAWMASLYFCSQGEALALMIPGGRREVELPALGTEEIQLPDEFELSTHQEEAVQDILEAKHDLYYLFGVTGSGKTEVFLKAAEAVLGQGRSVIYLVPEISLTHQLAQAVAKRFAGNVAILHSALSPSQRLKEWKKILHGEVHLVIGARSAVFAPCEDVGLIIVDEEHEHTYKSGSTPRYHARQIAFKKAALSGGVVVLGSATPSLESWYLMQRGRIRRLDLPERVSGGLMPKVDIVDMKRSPDVISPVLKDEMKQVLERGKQVILFLNRRGFSYFFHCKSCGYEMLCRNCSVAMTFHKQTDMMICHYCGYAQRPIQICPECGSLDVGYSGFGTELVEEAVQKYFPFARMERLDADTTKKQKHLQTVLAQFQSGEIDILLGTQMVAKGLNFPGVELVGIVLADSGLHLPDFRAHERTFSLLLQVAGRAGRFSNAGKVIIQTYQPENNAVIRASRGEVTRFYDEELQIRSMLDFPPITRMIRLVFRSKVVTKAEQGAEQAAQLLVEITTSEKLDVEILGPAEAPLARISGNARWQLLVKSRSFHQLHRSLSLLKHSYKPVAGVYMEIDVDPLNLM